MLKILSIVSFCISGFFTVQLLLSSSNGILNGLLTIGMALIFEFSKCLFLYKSIESKVNNHMVKYGTWIVTGFLFGLSVLASLSFLQNETNTTKNKTILKSDSYKSQLDAKKKLGEVYESKKLQITALQEQTQQQIKALEQQREALPTNYVTKKAQISKQIADLQSQSQSNISKVSTELEGISKESSKAIDVKNVEIVETKGYTSFLKVVAETLSNEDKTYSVEQLEIILFSLIAIVFEVVAVLLFYYNRLEAGISVKVEAETKNNNVVEGGFDAVESKKVIPIMSKSTVNDKASSGADAIKKRRVLALKKNFSNDNKSIGFKCEPKIVESSNNTRVEAETEFTDNEVKKYLDYMYQTQVGEVSKGYMSIAKNTGLGTDTARKIKGHLERTGILKTIGNKTIILKPK